MFSLNKDTLNYTGYRYTVYKRHCLKYAFIHSVNLFFIYFLVFWLRFFLSFLADFTPPGFGSGSAFRMRIRIQEVFRMRIRIRNTEITGTYFFVVLDPVHTGNYRVVAKLETCRYRY
jgi:hypothetical protein